MMFTWVVSDLSLIKHTNNKKLKIKIIGNIKGRIRWRNVCISLWADKEEEAAAAAEAEDNGTVLMTAVTQEQEQVSKLLRKERDY